MDENNTGYKSKLHDNTSITSLYFYITYHCVHLIHKQYKNDFTYIYFECIFLLQAEVTREQSTSVYSIRSMPCQQVYVFFHYVIKDANVLK